MTHTRNGEYFDRLNKSLVSASVLILSILFLAVSCKSTKMVQKNKLRPVYVTNTKKINLLMPENAAVTLDALQLFNGTFGDTSFSMISYTQIDESGISLSLMNDFGADMGNLFYDGSEVSFESAYLPSKLPGEYIVAEIQNAYYDEAALKKNYADAGLCFEVKEPQLRKIYYGKKLIEEIFISEESVKITNYFRGYSLELVNAE